MKMSKKIGLQRTPAKLKDLLETGLLEGLRVLYIHGSKGRRRPESELQGVIQILCSCEECEGRKVVSSSQWPLISRYWAAVRSQSPKLEMIDSLFKKVSDTEDQGIFSWELLQDFYTSSGQRKPDQIIIFRDGVSESQFNQVLNVELEQIIKVPFLPLKQY